MATDTRWARGFAKRNNGLQPKPAKPTITRPELFLIPRETVLAMKDEDLGSTYTDMEILGIAKLPYPLVDIGIPGDTIMKLRDKGVLSNDPQALAEMARWETRFRFADEAFYQLLIRNTAGYWVDLSAYIPTVADPKVVEAAEWMRRALIVLLATKNAVKTREKNKLLAMGIGKNNPKNNNVPIYTTTISLPKPEHMETEGDPTPGLPKRPHLRRGHIRNQRHGPSLQFVKRIWIEPVFVNADEDFVSTRSAYNTTLKGASSESRT